MTVAADIATDWQHVDGIEDVTYTRRLPSGDATDAAKAHRESLNFRETMLNGPAGLQPTDIVWVLWAATLAYTPSQGDTITDSAADVWAILSATGATIGATAIKYRCICRKQ